MMKNIFGRIVLIILGLPLLIIAILSLAYLLANRTNGTLISSGEKRAYLLFVPESYNADLPTPLVISIHGFAEWPAHQAEISRWNETAERFGFIVVYPSGTHFPKRWRTTNTGDIDTDMALDVAFIKDLIDVLSSKYNIDPTRVYANGLSNGGGMSFVLSCELSERISAFGSVAGAYLLPWDECDPSQPVPAVIFHGTDDPIVPFEGGSSGPFDSLFPLIPDWVKTLAQRNGCNEESLNLPASGEVDGIQFMHCEADVHFYTIAGGGHSWPGGGELPQWIVGHTTQDIDATQIMWDFFQQHPKIDK